MACPLPRTHCTQPQDALCAASWLPPCPPWRGLPSFPPVLTRICHVPFPSCWTISTKEIHISETPASFILIWLWGHIVSWPHVMSTLGSLPSLTPPLGGGCRSPLLEVAPTPGNSLSRGFSGMKPAQGCFNVSFTLD